MTRPYTDWREVPIPAPKGLEPIPMKTKVSTISSKAVKRFDYLTFAYWFRMAILSLTVLFGTPTIPVLLFLLFLSGIEYLVKDAHDEINPIDHC